MIGAINAAILKYVELTDKYQLDFYIEQDELLRNLDWDVFKMCIFLTLPSELICKYGSAEQFLSEFEGTLKHRNVESEDMSDMDEKRVRRVRIAGYNAFLDGKCVFCFYMLSLLIYTHVMEISGERERRDFLYSMIIFPCIHRIENQYAAEKEKELVMQNFHISRDKGGDEVQNLTENRNKVEEYIQRYGYKEYFEPMEVIQFLDASEEGRGFWEYSAGKRGRM